MEINNIIKTLLSKRGIDSEEEIQEFLSPKPRKTYDPLLLPDMEAGADLILHEIRNGSRIMIYGDYDADGITATTLMMSVLGHLMKDRPEDLDYYIPSRFGEGYGLNPEAIIKSFAAAEWLSNWLRPFRRRRVSPSPSFLKYWTWWP